MSNAVFISYARENGEAANAIAELLQEMGISCWIDKQTIAHQHGDDWAEEIVSAIKSSRLLIVVLSEHANASKYVKSEVQAAFDSDVPIIPFRVEDVAPQGSLALRLPSSQWVDAFPLWEKHLDALMTSVCRLLDASETSPRPGGGDRPREIGWRRFITGHVAHLHRSLRSSSRSGKPLAAPKQSPAAYGARKAAHEEASKEDAAELAKAHRWWRIKEVIDGLETRGLPLGRYAEFKSLLAKRTTTFQKACDEAEDALTKLGPVKAQPELVKLRQIIADHPDIEALDAKRNEMLQDRMQLQKMLDIFVTGNRWTAVENTFRQFAMKHGQATQSLLQAAERASGRALEETRRFDLLIWTIFAGVLILGACFCVENWLGISDGSFAGRFSDTTERLLIPAISTLVRFGTVVTTAGFVLAMFGVRHQGTFAGASIALMTVAAGAQALALAGSFVVRSDVTLPRQIDIAVSWLPCAVFGVTLMMAVQFATSLLIGVRPTWPGLTATLAAALASYGFLSERGIANSYLGQPEWSRWIPDAMLCASLLAVSGVIERKRSLWLLLLFGVGAGILVPTAHVSGYGALWQRTGPVILALLVAGWMAAGPTTLRSYLVLLFAACGSCLTAEYFRGFDERSGMLPYGRLCPLLAIWAVACGGVAIRHKSVLSPWFRGLDMLMKQVLRLRGAGARLHARQLAESAWFQQGREWHAKRASAAELPKQPAKTGQSSRSGVAQNRRS
jgi:hypothetical protein